MEGTYIILVGAWLCGRAQLHPSLTIPEPAYQKLSDFFSSPVKGDLVVFVVM